MVHFILIENVSLIIYIKMQLNLLHLFENEEQSTLNNEWYKVSIGDSK